MYLNRMETMDADDFVQEGFITVWKIVTAGNYDTNSGSFGGYLKKAIKYRFSRIWTDFCLKNPVCLGEREDCRGNITRFYGIAECAGRTREQGRERARRWREKEVARIDAERASQGLEPIYRPSKATEAEKAAHEEEMKRRRMERLYASTRP